MREPTIENAKVTGTMLGNEDHGIFTCFVFVEYDGGGCGFGGYALDKYDKEQKKRIGTAYGLEFIKRVLSTLEIEEWEKLKGTPCRVLSEGWGGGILKIGHFLKDKWFDPKALAKEFETEKVEGMRQ